MSALYSNTLHGSAVRGAGARLPQPRGIVAFFDIVVTMLPALAKLALFALSGAAIYVGPFCRGARHQGSSRLNIASHRLCL